MFGFNKKLKLEALKEDLKSTKGAVSRLARIIKELSADWDEYLEWKKIRDANADAAAKMGHFYITADDSALLERLIQEVNKDKDLAVLLTTAQGTTLSLRSHPQPQPKDSLVNYKKFVEGEE